MLSWRDSLSIVVCAVTEGVLMPAAKCHTQQMGERLIPGLLTVHLNMDVCVCVNNLASETISGE